MRADERGSLDRDRWVEALTWYVALRETDTRGRNCTLGREWLNWFADPENRRTFDHVSRLLSDRDRYQERGRLRKSELEDDPYDLSVPIAEWRKNQAQRDARTRRAPAKGVRWWLSGGLGVAAFAALVALWPTGFAPGSGGAVAAIYETSVAGINHVHLGDGSSVVLGGKTRLSVTLSARRRSVRLIEGQAWFKVAHDPEWPFVVAAGDGTITAVGTAFLVTRESDRVVVTVTNGTVVVSARPPVWPPMKLLQWLSTGSVPSPIHVSRGEQLAFSDSGALRPAKPVDTRAALAWTHGQLTFDDQPMRYVVQAINRYSSRRIVIASSAGALRFSGIVFADDIDEWLKSLVVIFPVSEEERGSTVYIRRRSTSPSSQAPLIHAH